MTQRHFLKKQNAECYEFNDERFFLKGPMIKWARVKKRDDNMTREMNDYITFTDPKRGM